jgi:hypothetical protein
MARSAAPSDAMITWDNASSTAAAFPNRMAAPCPAATEAVEDSARSRSPLSIALVTVRMFRTDRTAATRIVAPAMSARHFLKTDTSVSPRREIFI